MRASSLESSAESESSAMETGDGNSGQVAAVSSTASFKSPAVGIGEEETNGEKQVRILSCHFELISDFVFFMLTASNQKRIFRSEIYNDPFCVRATAQLSLFRVSV